MNSVISFGVSKRFLQAISQAQKLLGFDSRSELIRTSVRFFLRDQGFHFNEKVCANNHEKGASPR